jgi:5'-3' exonuclease
MGPAIHHPEIGRQKGSKAGWWQHGGVTEPRLLLLDTASVYYRAYYALPRSLRGRDGQPTNAVRGLLDTLARFIDEYSPTQLACCWDDSWRPSWRVALEPAYKAQRVGVDGAEEAPLELTAQVPLILKVLAALGLPVIGAAEFEADDVIATLAGRSEVPTDVITGDRDLFQVVNDARAIRVLYLARGGPERVDSTWLQQRYGVSPKRYVDFAVLRGDPSDGLPGVAGIGEKTAAMLVGAHANLDAMVAAAKAGELSPRQCAALIAAEPYLDTAQRVVTAVTDVRLAPVDLRLPRRPQDAGRFAELSAELNLGNSATRIVAALANAQTRNT